MNNIKMLYYSTIVAFEGINVNKTSESKECDICHYWNFSSKGFKFQLHICNRYHDLLIMSMNSNIAILKIKNSDYCCIISGISKSEVTKLLQNNDLTEKVEHYKK